MGHGRQRGFTLIELMVVMVIIGILLGLLAPALRRARENAKKERAAADCRTLAGAVRAYRHEYSQWPCADSPDLQTFESNNHLVFEYLERSEPPGPAPAKNLRNIQFLNPGEYTFDANQNIRDPWANCYRITLDLTNDSVAVASPGEDAVYGSGDDPRGSGWL